MYQEEICTVVTAPIQGNWEIGRGGPAVKVIRGPWTGFQVS